MLKIEGIHIDQFPFKGLKLISDLMSFEGEPFLRHYQDFKKTDIISYLVDYDNEKSRWLYAKITSDELLDYLNTTISLKEMLSNLRTDLKFFVEIGNASADYSKMTLIQDDINEEYLPKEESFFPIDIPEIYSEKIKNYNVVKTFDGIFMKAEPKEISKDRGLVKATDGADLLWAISTSFDNKVDTEIENKFISKGITEPKRINKAKKEVGKLYSMNIARVKVASFAVALCPNHYIPTTEVFLDKEWMASVLKSFKTDVVEIDNKSAKEVENLIESYHDKKDIKRIYEPLIRLYEHKNINVSLTDSDFKNGRILKPINIEVKTKLMPDEPKIVPIETERIARIKYNEEKHTAKLGSGYTLFDQDINTAWETLKIDSADINVKLHYPLISRYNETKGFHTLDNPTLDIYATGESKSEAVMDFYNQFIALYEALVKIENIGTLDKNELNRRRYLETIVESYGK